MTCGACAHTFRWQAWQRKVPCYTGNPAVARQFIDNWDRGGTAAVRMMHVDVLVQALHGRGELAPVFIEGDDASVRRLLDELAGLSPTP